MKRRSRIVAPAAGLVLLVPAIGLAQPAPRPAAAPAQPPAAAAKGVPGKATGSPTETKPDPAYETARTAFEALPETDRKAIQEALVWTDNFNAVDSGSFGRRTYDGILAWQKKGGMAEPNGVLDTKARVDLLAAGRAKREVAGFAVRTDPATGVALGVPTRILTQQSKAGTGTRWQSQGGKLTLETRAPDASEGDLQATFDKLAVSTPERKVTYKLKRPDFMVVSGETPTGKFFVRYAATPVGLRGFAFSYDKAFSEADRLVIAIANSFNPTPGATPPATAGTPPAPGSAAPTVAAAPPPPRFSATGLQVAPGRVLTSAAALAACPAPRIGAAAARVVAKSDALALLEGGTARPHPAAAGPAPESGADLVILVAGSAGSSVAPGEAVGATRLTAPLQPGAAGAPVFDRSGRLAGLVTSYPSTPRLVAGIVPPTGYDLVPAAAVAGFLQQNGVAPAAAKADAKLTTGAVAAPVAPALVAIACGG